MIKSNRLYEVKQDDHLARVKDQAGRDMLNTYFDPNAGASKKAAPRRAALLGAAKSENADTLGGRASTNRRKQRRHTMLPKSAGFASAERSELQNIAFDSSIDLSPELRGLNISGKSTRGKERRSTGVGSLFSSNVEKLADTSDRHAGMSNKDADVVSLERGDIDFAISQNAPSTRDDGGHVGHSGTSLTSGTTTFPTDAGEIHGALGSLRLQTAQERLQVLPMLTGMTVAGVEQLYTTIDRWDFDPFALNDTCGGHPLVCVAQALFCKHEMFRKLAVGLPEFVAFIAQIERGYRTANA